MMLTVRFKLADGTESAAIEVPVVPRIGERVRLDKAFPVAIDSEVVDVRHYPEGFRGSEPLIYIDLAAVAA